MVVTTDLADDTLDIHPKNKRDVGVRLAKLALSNTYDQKIAAAKSSVYKSFEIVTGKIFISFDNSTEKITSKKVVVTGLFIAGDNQQFYPAQAVWQNNKLVVWNKNLSRPVAVRYAFSNTAVGNLFTIEGMPVAPFRTDEWVVDTSSEGKK